MWVLFCPQSMQNSPKFGCNGLRGKKGGKKKRIRVYKSDLIKKLNLKKD